jgi:ribosomal protein S18 acetylase RimI-like enzyme
MAEANAIQVRKAAVDDAEVIAALNEHVQAVHATLLPEIFKPVGASTLTAADARAFLDKPDTLALLATSGGEAVGYAYAEVRRRPETAFAFAHDEVYLHYISVAAGSRRRGVGTALVNALSHHGAGLGITRLVLDVWTVNEPARAFFKAHGFEAYNERLARGGWGRV